MVKFHGLARFPAGLLQLRLDQNRLFTHRPQWSLRWTQTHTGLVYLINSSLLTTTWSVAARELLFASCSSPRRLASCFPIISGRSRAELRPDQIRSVCRFYTNSHTLSHTSLSFSHSLSSHHALTLTLAHTIQRSMYFRVIYKAWSRMESWEIQTIKKLEVARNHARVTVQFF